MLNGGMPGDPDDELYVEVTGMMEKEGGEAMVGKATGLLNGFPCAECVPIGIVPDS